MRKIIIILISVFLLSCQKNIYSDDNAFVVEKVTSAREHQGKKIKYTIVVKDLNPNTTGLITSNRIEFKTYDSRYQPGDTLSLIK